MQMQGLLELNYEGHKKYQLAVFLCSVETSTQKHSILDSSKSFLRCENVFFFGVNPKSTMVITRSVTAIKKNPLTIKASFNDL